jgi:glycine/D-amino acid oxidase-like deaminating enzyme
MRLTEEQASGLPELWGGDVAVAGGGSAGSAAALAAAREGSSVLLIESGGFFGGTAVAVLDTMYGFFPPGDQVRVVGGIAWEIASSLLRTGQAMLRENSYGAGTGVTYEPEALKRAWDNRLTEAGVRVLLHSLVTGVVMDGQRITGLTVHTRGGPYRISARRFVDATGDAVLAWAAGCALERPSAERRVQPLTTTFRVGGVSTPPAAAELRRLMAEAAATGMFELPRLEGSAHRTMLPGVFHTNMTRVSGADPTDPWALSAAEIEGRSQAAEYLRFLRQRVPGYQDSYLLGTSTWIGTRESRRLVGQHVLTRDDVIGARQFDDAIAICGAPVEDHDGGTGTIWQYVGDSDTPTGQTYSVPYRCLLPVEADGLLVAGRCLSATHDAHASARSIAQCLAYGEAAGTAAALSLSDPPVELRELDTDRLRARLGGNGVIL